MPCYSPLRGFKGVSGGISWTPSVSYVDVPMSVPCGQCIGCRLERSRQWAVRMVHEASLHKDNCFVTLTYDDAHLPRDGSLVKSHFQKFVKRLRKSIAPKRVSFFHCGEYGELNGRPHYHCILFGHDFSDRRLYSRSNRGDSVYESEALSRLWPFGIATVGNCTAESAAYCARYVVKKVTGDAAADHYRRVSADGEIYYLEPEYATMSLRPAIGKRWFEKFGSDVEAYDGVVSSGRLRRPPRYYDQLREGKHMQRVKRERVFKALASKDNSDARLKVREEVKIAAIRSLVRKI